MPFDNLKAEKLNLFLLAVFTFLSLVFAIFVPFFGFIGWALLPVSATLLVAANRKRDAIICAGLGVALFLFFDYLLAIFIAALIVGIAFLYENSVKKKIEAKKTISLVLGILVFLVAVYILLIFVTGGINFVDEFIGNYNDYINNIENDPIIKNYASVFAGAEFDQILQQTKKILRFFPYIFPGLLLVFLLMVAIVNYIASYKILKKFSFDLKSLPEFGKWDLSWHYSWGIILGITLLIFPTFIRVNDILFYALGANLLIVFGFIYFILGISVAWGLFEKYNLPMVWRVGIFLILALFFGVAIIIPVVGLLDVWINFRRLQRI